MYTLLQYKQKPFTRKKSVVPLTEIQKAPAQDCQKPFSPGITTGIQKQRQKRRAKTGVRKKLSAAIQILAATF